MFVPEKFKVNVTTIFVETYIDVNFTTFPDKQDEKNSILYKEDIL